MRENGSGKDAWNSATWRAEAVAWMDRALGAAGITRTGEVVQARVRPWSTVLRAETTAGRVWFKASGGGTAFEVPLYDVLCRIAPAYVLHPIGLDVDRAWLLLPDGGELHELEGDALVQKACTAFSQYAEFQHAVAPHVSSLLQTGVADMRPSVLPQRLEEALEYTARYVARRGTAKEKANHERLVAFRPRVLEWIARTAGFSGSPSLDHNDLHPFNVFITQEDGMLRARFYDWGDAVVAHPFACMLMGLGDLVQRLRCAPDDARIKRARDAYLEPFASLASHGELVEALELVVRVSWIARSLVWARAVQHADEAAPHAYPDAPMECLTGLLSEAYIAT